MTTTKLIAIDPRDVRPGMAIFACHEDASHGVIHGVVSSQGGTGLVNVRRFHGDRPALVSESLREGLFEEGKLFRIVEVIDRFDSNALSLEGRRDWDGTCTIWWTDGPREAEEEYDGRQEVEHEFAIARRLHEEAEAAEA